MNQAPQRGRFAGSTRTGLLAFASGLSIVLSMGQGTLWAADAAPVPEKPKKETPMPATIQDNMTVQLEYTLTSEGRVVDSTDGRGPFRYVHGKSQIVPGLERQLTGLHVGETKDVTVKPEEGYGPVNPSAFVEVPKEQLPPNITPAVGMTLRGTDPDGKTFRATIHEIKDKTVMLDLNHPLAGKTLQFKVKVVDIAPVQ